jgi:hypothetical protein
MSVHKSTHGYVCHWREDPRGPTTRRRPGG